MNSGPQPRQPMAPVVQWLSSFSCSPLGGSPLSPLTAGQLPLAQLYLDSDEQRGIGEDVVLARRCDEMASDLRAVHLDLVVRAAAHKLLPVRQARQPIHTRLPSIPRRTRPEHAARILRCNDR